MPRMIRNLASVGLLVTIGAALCAAPPVTAAEGLSGRVGAAAGARLSKAMRASIGVWDAKTGELLHETNGSTPRRPASAMKVATTAAALLTLGASAELSTDVLTASRPDAQGRLDGDLVVRGGGDVGINNRAGAGAAEAALQAMAKAVRDAGVTSVTGNLVLDDSAFTGASRHPGWAWDDGEWAWFKAPVAALLLTDACVEVTVLPGAGEGAAAVIQLDPPTTAVRFANRVITAASKQKKTNVVLGRMDDTGTIPVTGNVPAGSAGYHFDAACVDPAEHFGDVFLRVLRAQGVAVAGQAVVLRRDANLPNRSVTSDPVERTRLAHHGTTVLDTVRIANKHSQNLYAEVLLRALGRAAGDGSFEGGCRAVRKALGFDPADATFVQVDGSGLARENQATVGALGRVLVKMYGSPLARDYIASLPGAGEADSTLRKRFEAAKYDGRVFAKTGTLRDTSSLAGYVRGESGRTYAFAVLCEGDVGRSRELQDDVVEILVGQ